MRTAGPIVVSQLGMVGMNTVDTLMVGPLGATALAATVFSGAIHNTTIQICFGIVMGMSPLVSQAFGAGDRARCREVLVQGLWLALALSLPLFWVSVEGETIAHALGQDGDVATLAGSVSTNAFTDIALGSGLSFRYEVAAYDVAGNVGPRATSVILVVRDLEGPRRGSSLGD